MVNFETWVSRLWWDFAHIHLQLQLIDDDVIQWKHFPRYWHFVQVSQSSRPASFSAIGSDPLAESVRALARDSEWVIKPVSNTSGVVGARTLHREFNSHCWIPLTKASDIKFWYFLWFAPEQMTKQTVKNAGDLRRHRGHYDVTIMATECTLKIKTHTYLIPNTTTC